MSTEKYQFNLDSLSFTEVKRGLRYWSKLIVRYMLAGIALAVLAYVIFSFVAYTPSERQLAEENRILEESLHHLREKYGKLTQVLSDLEKRDGNIHRLLFESEPLPSDQQVATEAINSLFRMVKSQGVEVVVDSTTSLLASLSAQAPTVSSLFDELVQQAQGQNALMQSIPSIQPIENAGLSRIAAPFGVRIHPFYKVLKRHTGVDYAVPVGTPILATAGGQIQRVNQSRRGLGNTLLIDHGNGYKTLYAHLGQIEVRWGARVARGQRIATVGNSGMSLAPHLHYEVLRNDQPVDPLNYFFQELSPHRLDRLAQIASQAGQTMD